MKYQVGFVFKENNFRERWTVVYISKFLQDQRYLCVCDYDNRYDDAEWFSEHDIDACLTKKTVKYEAFEQIDGKLEYFREGSDLNEAVSTTYKRTYTRMPDFDIVKETNEVAASAEPKPAPKSVCYFVKYDYCDRWSRVAVKPPGYFQCYEATEVDDEQNS